VFDSRRLHQQNALQACLRRSLPRRPSGLVAFSTRAAAISTRLWLLHRLLPASVAAVARDRHGDRFGLNLELFPCSGGMAEGFRRAGVIFDMAFDFDPDAVASYALNHGRAPIRMDVRDLLRMVAAGRSPGRVELLVAGPSCTRWSRAGERLDALRTSATCLAVRSGVIAMPGTGDRDDAESLIAMLQNR
jgi:hypothetical protein